MTDSALAVSDGHVFSSFTAFDNAQRMAKALASSALVPKIYQGQQGLANSLIALELAGRMGISPLTVMQNMTPINGRPSWSSSFLIGTVNACGRFSPLRFIFDDAENPSSCYAEANDLATGEVLRGEKITIAMARAEGWFSRQGSKWQTFPGQMLRYRAGAFWARVYCPEISLGIITKEEAIDVEPIQVSVSEPQLPEILDDTSEPAATSTRGTKTPQLRGSDRARSESDAREINGGVDGSEGTEGGVHSDVPADGSVSAGDILNRERGAGEVGKGVSSDAQSKSNETQASRGAPIADLDTSVAAPDFAPPVDPVAPVAADPPATPAPLKLRDKQQLIRTVNSLPKEKIDELTAALIAEFGFDNQTQMSIQLTHQNHADFIHAFIKGQGQ